MQKKEKESEDEDDVEESDCESGDYELSEEDIEFVMDNTGFNKEQINFWFADFLKKCSNGYISKKQFCTYYKSLMPSN